MTKYDSAPAVKAIADELIPKHYPHLLDFGVKMEYRFVDKIPKKGGKEVWGTCRKISNLPASLAQNNPDGDPFFAIVISAPIWDILPDDKRRILVSHELEHCIVEYDEDDENPAVKLSIKPHDLEEFTSIVKRFGLWRDDVKEFIEAAKVDKVE
jgi:hypothetical protein